MATVGQPDAMRRITVHYANPPARGTEEANLDGIDNDLLEFVIGDVLQDQGSLYQSIFDDTDNNHIRGARTTAPSDNSHYYYHGESSSTAATTSRTSDIHEQIESDFEYARQLQEMDYLTIETPPNEQDDISCVASPSDTDDDDNNEQEAARQDDDDGDDPDNMTYEQRQALVESVGTEDRGLSDQLICYLVPWKYKSGFFSRKRNHEDCPICLSTFRNRERLITLPCKHNYHAGCVAKWLKIDKVDKCDFVRWIDPPHKRYISTYVHTLWERIFDLEACIESLEEQYDDLRQQVECERGNEEIINIRSSYDTSCCYANPSCICACHYNYGQPRPKRPPQQYSMWVPRGSFHI